MGIVPIKVCDAYFLVYNEYCIYFEKISQIYTTHREPNRDTIPTLWKRSNSNTNLELVLGSLHYKRGAH